MDSFLGNTRQFFQGLPATTRGYGGPALRDDNHAPPTPTPPATPTLPPAHVYHPYLQPVTGAVPATSVPGLLPPSRPMTPVTPSHKPPDHGASAPPYNVTSFLHPPSTKPSSASDRYLAAQFDYQCRQATLAAASVVSASSTRSTDSIHSPRTPSQSHNNGQGGLGLEPRLPTRTYANFPLSAATEGRSHQPVVTTQAPSTELQHPRHYSSTQSHPNDLRAYPHPYGSQNSSDSRAAHSDKFFPRPEPRPPESRLSEARQDPRAGLHQEQWSPYRTPDAKSLERLPPSVHISEAPASVNGSKDALYLGKKTEEMANVRHPDNSFIGGKSIESLQVNGSRDPLYPNGSHSVHSSEGKRDPSSGRKADNRPKEDSALDLSVKTVRQTPDCTAVDLEKSHSNSPHSGLPAEKPSLKDPQRKTPSSVPVTSPYRTSSRDPSPSQISELIKNAPGISGPARGASPSQLLQYSITGSPRPLQSPSPLLPLRASHMLPPTKRTGDPSYFDHLPKLPRLSHTPPNKLSLSRHVTEAPLADHHPRDRSLPVSHKEVMPDQNRGLNLLIEASDRRYIGESTIEKRSLHNEARDPSVEWREQRDLSQERRDISTERKDPSLEIRRDLSIERKDPSLEVRRDLSSERREPTLEIRRDLSSERREPGLEIRRDLSSERREPGLEIRRDLSNERREPSLEIRRDLSSERREPTLEIRRDLSSERREPSLERKDLSITRKEIPTGGKDPAYDKRENLAIDPKYAYLKHHSNIAASTDPYRTSILPPDQSKLNSLTIERQKYMPGHQPVPTSVPTSLPQQNSRVPSAQLHPYSSYRHPPDTKLPQTPYSQASHIAAAPHPSQLNPIQSTPAKMHQFYGQQPSSSRANQVSSTPSSSHSSQSPATVAGQPNSATQPLHHHYPYPYNQAAAAHYAQQQHQHRQPRPTSAYPPFSLPQSTKSSPSSSTTLPPPLTPQQVHQAYLYAQHRNDSSLNHYSSKRSNQLSPHPSGSPHPSISPHPSASPNTAASPHPSASPHHMMASPRSAVSPHLAQQPRMPSQYSPHPSQRPPPATSSASQHSYPGSLPPSPYSGLQAHPSHTTPPSSRPSSATSQHSNSSQPSASSQPQRSPYPSPALLSQPSQSPAHQSQSTASHTSQPYPASSQPQSSHPSQGPAPPPPPHSSQSRTGSQPQPHTSHAPSSQAQQVQSSTVSSAQSHHSHTSSHPPATHHTQAHIYSQPHPTWTTQPCAGHTTKPTDGHPPPSHPSHSYPAHGYPHYPHSTKPHHSQSALPQPYPHPSQSYPPYPSQAHPPHPSQARPPHALQGHPPASSQSHPPHSSQTQVTHPSQAHPTHPSQTHPPHPSQAHLAHPHVPHTSQAQPSQPRTSQAHPQHPSHPHPSHAASQARPPHPSQSAPGHPPHPSQTHVPQAHPSQAYTSQAHPQHPSRPHPSHASQAHPPHPSQSAPGHPPHPSQAHPSHPSQAYPSQAHDPPTSSSAHSSQAHAPPTSSSAHSSHTSTQPSQAHPQPSSSAHPSRPSQDHPPRPSQAHPPHPPSTHPSQAHPPHSSTTHSPHPSSAHPSIHPPHPSSGHPSQAHLPHPSSAHAPHPSSAHPPHPPSTHPSQAHPPHLPSAHPPSTHPQHPSSTHPPHPSTQHPSSTHPPHLSTHPPHPSSHPPHPSSTHPPHPSSTHPPHPSSTHPPHPSSTHPPHPSSTHPPHPSSTHPPHPSSTHPPHPSSTHPPHPSSTHPPHPSSTHPPHPSSTHPPHPSAHPSPHSPHPSSAHPHHPSQAHPPHSSAHPQYPSQAHPPYPSQVHPPHPSSAHPHPPPKAHPSHASQPSSQSPPTQPTQSHPQPSHPPLPHPSQAYPPQAYPPQPHPSHPQPSNSSSQPLSQTRVHHQPHSPRGPPPPPQSQAQSRPQSLSPRGHSAQPHSPRGHPSHPSPGHPHAYPSQEYPLRGHPSQESPLQGYPPPHGHPSQIHPSQPHHPQMRLPYSSPIRPPYTPTTQPQSLHHPGRVPTLYPPHPHVPHSTSGHHHPSESSQPHPPHPVYPHHGQRHPYYPHQQLPHPAIKTEDMAASAQYPAYPPYPSPHAGSKHEITPSRTPPHHHTQLLPTGTSCSPRPSQDYDPSRIRTKGEQKAFDPRNAESGKPSSKPESQPGSYPSDHQELTPLQSVDTSKGLDAVKPTSEPLETSNLEGGQKAPTVCEEGNKVEQAQAASKSLEPGKAALAVKLYKKLHRPESEESLVPKKEIVPETVAPIKEEPPVEDEWDKGFDKLMEDLAANPDGVTSRKCRSLGRRYLQKVQIQNAIDNDLIIPPVALSEEEEEESEPEAPIKFRGKFKSIKDKKVERLILTYASHSDESAQDMIPDDDASDFEEELKREIRLKSKKRGHTKKKVPGDTSSGSEAEKGSKKWVGGRGTNKENKPNNKQDSDYSLTSSNSSSDSSSSSSDSDDDSDSEDTDLEELVQSRRKGKKSDREKQTRGKKWDSDSTDSEEEVLPKRRSRRGRKFSSDEDSFKPSQRNKKRRKKSDSSESDEIPLKSRRRRKKLESEDEEELVTRRGKKKSSLNKKYKVQKDESDEDSDTEIPRKTRGMKKKLQESKKGKRRKQVSAVSSSDSDEATDKKGKKIDLRRKRGKNKSKCIADSTEDSDIPAKKKSSPKANVIVDSDDSDTKKENSRNKDPEEKKTPKEKASLPDEAKEAKKETTLDETELPEGEEEVEDDLEEENKEPDSVIEKLKKIRDEELNREDVQEMKAWLSEVNRDIEKQLGKLQDVTLRQYWKKPQFGGGDDFLHGWQAEVKRYKELTARFPKKLCHATKHQAPATPSKSSRKAKDQESAKESPRRGTSSPAKNTRSKSGIIKTSLSVAEDERLKVAARPEISSVMQRFFEKVLAETGSDSSKEEASCRKFTLSPFPAFGAPRVPTGLTPTPSVAPSMLASDDSDLDSLASLRMDLPASDSVPVSKRSIASSLLKKIGRKYNDKKLNTLNLNKTRNILQVTNKPQLLPTPGMPTSLKDLEEMSPDQLKMATFFRKETVENYRGNFELLLTKNGLNESTPTLYQSRTRNKTKQIQNAATVRSVFGLDIPPHILNKTEAKKSRKVTKKTEKKDETKKDESLPIPISRASTPGGSVLAAGEDDDDSELRSERSESVLGESSVSHVRKRVKRKFRKFRSGFDYIRKKKKVKADDEATPSRKRFPVRKHVNWPEQSRDVASEVRAWVVNKGLGETVLHKAARLQYHDVVVYCAESPDFDINVRDNAGYTPLHEACNRGHLDIAQVLCAHGAHVNAPGYKGMRPLHEAVENGHGELARLLLAYGADPTLTTYAGQTCLALSPDMQTTRLIEGFLADLKGQRTIEKWYFAGPATIFDPEEQGCDIFGNIPGSNTLLSRQITECREESNNRISEVSAPPESSSVDGIAKCQNTLDSDKDNSLLKPVKLEGVVNEQNSSSKQTSHNPKASEKTEAVCSSNEAESVVKSESVKESEDDKPEETDNTLVNKETSVSTGYASQESESESDWEGKELLFETSELQMLDLFEVEGRPYKYHLLLDILTHLKMTYKEFIMNAKTVETLELNTDEFEGRAHSCIVGSGSRDSVGSCSRVVLVRVTPAIEKLLGIEAVKL